MKPTLCSKCKKNLAVVFITKIENGETINEGYCLKCAKELGIKPVDDMISRMGLSDEDLESISGEMLGAMNGLEGLMANAQNQDDDTDDEDDDNASQTATFPFLNKLFGAAGNNGGNFTAQSARLGSLVNDEHSAGLARGLQYGGFVHGIQRAQIKHLNVCLLPKLFRAVQR